MQVDLWPWECNVHSAAAEVALSHSMGILHIGHRGALCYLRQWYCNLAAYELQAFRLCSACGLPAHPVLRLRICIGVQHSAQVVAECLEGCQDLLRTVIGLVECRCPGCKCIGEQLGFFSAAVNLQAKSWTSIVCKGVDLVLYNAQHVTVHVRRWAIHQRSLHV